MLISMMRMAASVLSKGTDGLGDWRFHHVASAARYLLAAVLHLSTLFAEPGKEVPQAMAGQGFQGGFGETSTGGRYVLCKPQQGLCLDEPMTDGGLVGQGSLEHDPSFRMGLHLA